MTELTTTLNMLKKHNPCLKSWSMGLEYCKKHNIGLDDAITFKHLHKVLGDRDLIWSTCILYKKQRVFLGAKIAQQVVHLTDDKRVHECLAVCFKYANGDVTEKELRSAAHAAYSAISASATAASASATAAAYSAAAAAYSAAAATAYSAASAASAAAAVQSKSAQIILDFCKTGEMR